MNITINGLRSLIKEFVNAIVNSDKSNQSIEELIQLQKTIHSSYYDLLDISLKVANLDFESREMDCIDNEINRLTLDDEFHFSIDVNDIELLYEHLSKFKEELEILYKML